MKKFVRLFVCLAEREQLIGCSDILQQPTNRYQNKAILRNLVRILAIKVSPSRSKSFLGVSKILMIFLLKQVIDIYFLGG